MSTELMDLFIGRTGIEIPEVDPDGINFEYGGTACSLESINEDTIKISIGDNSLVSDDIDEVQSFFDAELNITRERTIDELARELRTAFKR